MDSTTPAESTLAPLPSWRTQSERDRDRARLDGTHPDLARIVIKILDAMEVFGFPMFVTEAVRSDERQRELYAQGRTTPGSVVTNTDGVIHLSMHQHQLDGLGHAVDCAFLDDPLTVKKETYDVTQPWGVYGAMAEAYGLTWGGRWTSLVDRPHIELPLARIVK